MFVVRFLLSALVGSTIPSLALAGEIVLWSRASCQSYPTIFSANNTTDCRKADQDVIGPLFYGASTSRNIGPSCTFNLYTDLNCKTSVGKIISSGPFQNCLPITKGLGSYKVTCAKPAGGNLIRPRAESDLDLNTYAQPLGSFRGKPSGHHRVEPGIDICGNFIPDKPTGGPSSAGVKLASSFFNNVPANVHEYTFSAVDGGTLYTVTLHGTASNNYTAAGVAQYMGQAAFASMMADTVAQLTRRPCDYLYYYLGDEEEQYLGGVNTSFVAP